MVAASDYDKETQAALAKTPRKVGFRFFRSRKYLHDMWSHIRTDTTRTIYSKYIALQCQGSSPGAIAI